MLHEADHDFVDRRAKVGRFLGQPLANQLVIGRSGSGCIVRTKVVVLVAECYDALASRLVQTVGGNAEKTGHGLRLLPDFYRPWIPETAPPSLAGKP
jgi:hypothetical protein